jgi:PKD repeat protein
MLNSFRARRRFCLSFLVALVLPARASVPPRATHHHSTPRKVERYDQPAEAQAFFLAKRSPDGVSPIDTGWYFDALERMKDMPQHSTAVGQILPSRRQLGIRPEAIEVLGTWSWLGPGNVGGRTRTLVVAPSNSNIMYAGAAGGGVWKSTNAGTSWTPLTDFLASLAVSSLAMDPSNPNVLYAGTGEGFFNSDSLRGAGIFKTTDGGATWTQLPASNNSNFYYVNRLAISPNNPQRVYAATRTGIFRSTDGGATWSQVYTSSLSGGCTDLQIRTDQSNDFLFAAEGNQVQGNILRNTNAGAGGAWSVVFTEAGMGRASIAIAPSNQAIVYALTAEIGSGNYKNGLHAVYRSVSNGDPGTWTTQVSNQSPTYLNTLLLTNPRDASWTNCGMTWAVAFLNQGWYDNIIRVDPVNPDRVWAGGIDLFRSDDGGANWGLASYWWSSHTNPRFAHADQHAIVFHPSYNGSSNQTMFVGNDGGIFRTDNAASGTTATGITGPCNTGNSSLVWTSLNNNYGATQFFHGAAYPDGKTFFGGAQDNGTARGSDAAGPNAWSQINGGDGGYVAVDPTNTNVLYSETTQLSIIKSTDGGGTFNEATTGITESSDNFGFITPFAMDPGNHLRLWTAGRTAWRSVDGAATWTAASAPLTTGDFPATAIAVSPQDGNYVLIGRSSGFIRRTTTALSTDSTTAWSQSLPTDPTQVYNSWLAFDPTNKNIAYATYSTFGVPHVWKSTDAGATWTNISGSGSTGIPDIPVLSIVVDPTNTSRLYVGTDLGVFTSIDGGANWMIENTGFANVSTEALTITGTNLYAFTHGRGAYRVALAGIQAPAAGFSFAPVGPQPGQSVQFTDTSTNSPTSWSWSFGDGGTSAARNPTHAYAAAGTYTVSLTAANSGGSGTTSHSLTVAAPAVGRGHVSPVPRPGTLSPVSGRH